MTCEFVVAGRHTPALLDFVEEPFENALALGQAGAAT